MNFELILKFYAFCNKYGKLVPEEEIKTLPLTEVTNIYSDWFSNDMGVDFDLYLSSCEDGAAPRYFLRSFDRDWYGGFSTNDTTEWYEITKEAYTALRDKKHEWIEELIKEPMKDITGGE